jgi:hypothetical protein
MGKPFPGHTMVQL